MLQILGRLNRKEDHVRTILFAIGALAVAGIVAASPLAASGK